ncbi:AAA domain-containing protein [Jimgerdemannia flammicorona]|uniref:AAA domain-containing protein n=1 Tax=Jimgerdemannia flammicorona TaxID=994334 RepID=A0A433PME2_9FUNG|nr:AAA domain-containing protein [Jimgerdemannia flammicorona]
MDHARIIFSTVSTAGSECIANRRDISTIIVDEAAQLVEAESLIILKQSCERLCLVGDTRQLSTTVQSRRVEHHGYRLSMFEQLLDNGWTPCLLDEQYRMHPKISAWPIRKFYEGKLKDAANTLSDEYSKFWHADNVCKPLLFFECADGREEHDDKHSFANHMEADIVCSQLTHWLSIVHNSPGSQMGRPSIGVIAPYTAQVALLESKLKDLSAKYSSDISVKSVDGFQGQERDVIIFSATRSNSAGKIGFLADHKRLNVAITRPKFSLSPSFHTDPSLPSYQ